MKHSLLFLTLLLFLVSCQKQRNDELKKIAQDNALAEISFNTLWAYVDKSMKGNSTFGKTSGEENVFADTCAIININSQPNQWPKTMEFDFGNGCTDQTGTEYKGIITATFSGKYHDPGTTITITTNNFHINGNLIEGVKTITNTGRNAQNNLVFTVIVPDGKISTASGDIITWTTNRQWEWIKGESTVGWFNICDDVYLITGNINGINREGNPYTINITSPLMKEVCCPWIVSGKVDISSDPANPVATIDYGDGQCDRKFSLTVGNKVYVINM